MTVSVKSALGALKGIQALVGPEGKFLLGTLAQFIAERHVAEAPDSNTGLPCTYCGQKQEKVVIERDGDAIVVRVSMRATLNDLKELKKLFTMFSR